LFSCDFEPEPSDPDLPRAAVFFFTAFDGLAAAFVDFADFAEPDDLVVFVVFEDAFAFDAFTGFDDFDALADFPAFDALALVAFADFAGFDAFDALALVLFFGFAMSLRPPAGC
jgi:hypothetical protein